MKVTFRPSSSQPKPVDHQAVKERHRDLDTQREERLRELEASIRHEEKILRQKGLNPTSVDCYKVDRLLKNERTQR